MLLDTIRRHDTRNTIKLVCIESLRAAKQSIPPQIHSVPALVNPDTKHVLFGKHVFDYLLLPGSGKLLIGASPTPTPKSPEVATSVPDLAGEPHAYALVGGLSDAFAPIDDTPTATSGTDALQDRSYSWTSINESPAVSVYGDKPIAEETRAKKNLPDLDAIRAQRELDLKQSDINNTALIPPSFTR